MVFGCHACALGLSHRLTAIGSIEFPGNFNFPQEIRDITLKLEMGYHEKKKEKGIHQEKKPPVTGSKPFRPPQDSNSKKRYHKKTHKGKNIEGSEDNPHAALLNKNNKLIGSKKKRRIKEGLCTYSGGKHPIK
ncbi:hypothetical protein O181_114451 [Austropuccinia psidii MF-1]|uniref:Uncharacterized protein n=1 Tax=Austropuccinia psidii MF-1 TaxID=1389203 RepID=A0A9Q3K6V8_9BASI|nr:hypothetical protein [Austropuccinia psidii MF-1]